MVAASGFRKAMGLKARTQENSSRPARNAAKGKVLRTATFHGDLSRPGMGGLARSGSPVDWNSVPTEQDGDLRRARAATSARRSATDSRRTRSKGSKPGAESMRALTASSRPVAESLREQTEESSKPATTVLTRSSATGEFVPSSRSRTSTQTRAQRSVEMAARSDARSRGVTLCPKPRPCGAHYETVGAGLIDNADDPDKLEHDKMLADTLHKLRPEDPRHPMLNEPRLPMNTAFTDRSNRMNEGRCVKAALPKSGGQGGADWFTSSDHWGEGCGPSSIRAAGAASYLLADQKLDPSSRDVHPEAKVTDMNLSEATRSCLTFKPGCAASTAEDERALRRTMGSRIKAPDGGYRKTMEPGQAPLMMQHRTLSPRSSDYAPAAGQYNMHYRPEISMGNVSKFRQPFQGSRSVSPDTLRSGVALCISSREGDHPAPTKISHARRGDGQFKAGLSAEAESHTLYQNQGVLRFASPETTRGRNTLAPDYESHAGKTTKAITAEAERTLGRSPSPQRRHANLNNSSQMNTLMDEDVQKGWQQHERKMRLACEKPFADLCTTASTHYQTQRSLLSTVKSLNDQHHGPKLDLSWPGAEN